MKRRVVLFFVWLICLNLSTAVASEPVKIAAIFATSGIGAGETSAYIEMVELAVKRSTGMADCSGEMSS